MRTLIILCVAGALAGCATQATTTQRSLVAVDCHQIAQNRIAGMPSDTLSEAFRTEYSNCLSQVQAGTVVR